MAIGIKIENNKLKFIPFEKLLVGHKITKTFLLIKFKVSKSIKILKNGTKIKKRAIKLTSQVYIQCIYTHK